MARLPKIVNALLAVFIAVFMMAAPVAQNMASAQPMASTELERENSDINKMFHKLGRGVVNVLTGWVEIPKTIAKEWTKTDPITGTVTGAFKGVVVAIARTFVGFYEVISFPFPVPSDYQVIMEPEFVLPTVWGDRLPLYRDEFKGTAGSIENAVDYGSSNPALGNPSNYKSKSVSGSTSRSY
jgi:putative exosortase-associated protein (TIGR04073 family)